MTKVAIMQPCFLPYINYFQLMNEVDKFIILDNVQFSKQSWQQRNKVQINGVDKWLTVPVKQKLGQLINEVQINNCDAMYKMQNFIQDKFRYGMLYTQTMSLFELNYTNINKLKIILGIDTELLIASGLGQTDIVTLTDMVGGTEYISTGGSRVYFDDELENRFLNKGITIKFNDYEPDYSIIQYMHDTDYLKQRGFYEI